MPTANCRTMPAIANAASPNASSVQTDPTPSSAETTITPTPNHAGIASRRRSTSPDVARHGSAGAIAMRNSNAIPIGVAMRSK